jgi:hypothetical protein
MKSLELRPELHVCIETSGKTAMSHQDAGPDPAMLGAAMTFQAPQEPNPGPARSALGNVIFFFAVVALIVAIASIGIFSERTASNAPTQPEITTVGQSRPSPPTAK